MSQSPTTETGTAKTSTLKDESSINFRPSPNFKHMKKYLKSKFEEDMSATPSSDPLERNEHLKVNVAVQPPLPPNSPPPDSPLSFTLKKEIEDDEYEMSTSNHNEGLSQEDSNLSSSHSDQGDGEGSEKKKPIMCKDFIRKKCKRGAACIYAHKIIKSQLKDVYKFCRDFENQRCSRPVCYFVHATTFEKEHFIRTGYLPPHALAHLESVPETNANGPPSVPPIFTNPPPPIPTRRMRKARRSPRTLLTNTPGAVAAAAAAAVMPRAVNEPCIAVNGMPALPTLPTDSLKREWRESDEAFNCSPRDIESSEPVAKKCKRCDITEMRLQHSKSQMAEALRNCQELDENIQLMVNKHHHLQSVLRTLLKPRRMLEHVHNNLLTPNRLTVLGEERNKDALLSQMKVLLTKILLSSGENGSPESDPST